MNCNRFSLVLLLLVLIAGSCAALPNLKVDWVQYNPESGRIVAEVSNDSAESADGFTVNFSVDGEVTAYYLDEYTLSLGPKSLIQVFADFPFDGKNHEFYAAADPTNAVTESSEEDNAAVQRTSFEEEKKLPASDSYIEGNPYGYLFNALLILTGFCAVVIAAMLLVRRWMKKHAY